MATEWGTVITSVISAASGLGGVALGGWITSKREARQEGARRAMEASYLAIIVSAHLDKFYEGCSAVAFDDGTTQGLPAGDRGECVVTVARPTFDPLTFDVDWKVLPTMLMHEVLRLPYRVDSLEARISGTSEYDTPPDYAEFFWERQHGYAVLGLEVSSLSRKLLAHAGLSLDTASIGGAVPDDVLRKRKDKLEQLKEAYKAGQVAEVTAWRDSAGPTENLS